MGNVRAEKLGRVAEETEDGLLVPAGEPMRPIGLPNLPAASRGNQQLENGLPPVNECFLKSL